MGVSFLVKLQVIERSISPSQVFFPTFHQFKLPGQFVYNRNIMSSKKLRNYQKLLKRYIRHFHFLYQTLHLHRHQQGFYQSPCCPVKQLSTPHFLIGDNFEFALHQVAAPIHTKQVVEHHRQKSSHYSEDQVTDRCSPDN